MLNIHCSKSNNQEVFMNMQIVSVSPEAIDLIKTTLAESGTDQSLRIVGSLGFGDLPEGFKLFPGEATPKDKVQEIDGITFIVADILVKLYGSFSITRHILPEVKDVVVMPVKPAEE
jgi:hypothetical protein